MAMKVAISKFKMLSHEIRYFYSMETWAGSAYISILTKNTTGRKITQLSSSKLILKSRNFRPLSTNTVLQE